MNNFIRQLATYIILVVLLSLAAVFLPSIAPAGWMTTAIVVLIWVAAAIIGFRAISWGAKVYIEEIGPRTRSDADSPFLVNTIRNLALAAFLFVIGGGIATAINEEFNASFFAGGLTFAFTLGLAPVLGAYILDVRRASIIDKELNEGDFIQVGEHRGFVKGQDANFLELITIPEMHNVQIDHANVFGEFVLLEEFTEISYDNMALGAVIESTMTGCVYTYTDKNGREVTMPIEHTVGVSGQPIVRFDRSIGYYRVIGEPLITLEIDADGPRAAEDPSALLDVMLEWYADLPDNLFDKTFEPELYNHVYIEKSSAGDGACVPARMMVRALTHQLVPEATRAAQTTFALKALAGGWGYGTTSNITIGNAADFRA